MKSSSRSSIHTLAGRLLLLVVLLAVPFHALAQQDVGYISGIVTDTTGSLVPAARVHIQNDQTGVAIDVVTNESGYYTSQPLHPSRYTITVTAPGFTTTTLSNLALDAAARVTANASLKVGASTEYVEIQAQAPTLNTTDAQIANTVDQRATQDLPVNGRSVLALATLSAGVTSAVGATSQGFTNRGTQPSAIRISGGVPGLNNNLLDGANNLQNFHGEIGINVKSDAVEEFRIMSGVIPAQFGYTSGGVVNVITRSGGNRLHGSVYEFFRNDALDATLALPKPVFGKPELRFNNYGGTLGGPIRHDRAFFFGDYEEYRFINAQTYYSSVPTDQERAGDYSDLGRRLGNGGCSQYPIDSTLQLYNPFTSSPTQSRQPYANNKLTNLDPVALAAQELMYPRANNTAGSYDSCTHANNYVANPKLISNERTAMGRIDYRLSDKDSLFGRLAFYRNYQNNATFGYSPLYYRNDTLSVWNGVLSETHAFSASLLNDFRIAVLRATLPFLPQTYGQNYASKMGLKNSRPDLIPAFSNGLNVPNNALGFRASTTMEIMDDVTRTMGSHTLRLGFDGRLAQSFNLQSNYASGLFNFSGNQTAAGTSSTVQTSAAPGNIYASFLIGAVNNATAQLAAGTEYRKWLYAAYLQDDWHVNARLTLNFGLRYDFMKQPYEKHNGYSNFDINVTNPTNGFKGAAVYAGFGGYGTNFVRENWNNWGPRAGFALLLTPNGKTVARGGYAVYYPTTAQNAYMQGAGSSNGFGSLGTSWTSTTNYGPAFTLAGGIPYPATPPLGAAGGPNAFLGQSATYVSPSLKDPSSQQYTVTLSHELPSKTVVDVSYLGNHGRHFDMPNININTLDPSYYSLGTAYLNASVQNPYAGQVPGALGAPTITRANLLKPFPYMSAITLGFPRAAHFDGNYLLVNVQRRSDTGLQLIASYTYGKLMSLPIYTDLSTVTGTPTGNGLQNWRNLDADYSIDAIDVRHRGTIAALYNLPFGKGKRFLNDTGAFDRLVSGYQFNVVMTAEGGRPLGITGASNQGTATRPNLVPGASLTVPNRGKNGWFNTAAFVNPPDYTFGNTPRYFSGLRGPGTLNFDLSVFKTTRLTEGSSLELRIEGYNAFNHVNLGMPNTTFTAGAGGLNVNNNFGVITSASAARQVQLGAKLRF